MKLTALASKVKNKGIKKSFSIFFNACIFSHWKMYVLERDLVEKSIDLRLKSVPTAATKDNLDVFKAHFSHYIPSIKKLINEGSRSSIYIDENNNAYAMLWVHEGGDYYDNLLYKCKIPIPQDSIYQFAGEVAKHKRGGRLTVEAQQSIWNEYYEKGFKRARSLVNGNNTAALKMHFRLGFKETGEMIHIYRLLNLFTFSSHENYVGNKINK